MHESSLFISKPTRQRWRKEKTIASQSQSSQARQFQENDWLAWRWVPACDSRSLSRLWQSLGSRMRELEDEGIGKKTSTFPLLGGGTKSKNAFLWSTSSQGNKDVFITSKTTSSFHIIIIIWLSSKCQDNNNKKWKEEDSLVHHHSHFWKCWWTKGMVDSQLIACRQRLSTFLS